MSFDPKVWCNSDASLQGALASALPIVDDFSEIIARSQSDRRLIFGSFHAVWRWPNF
jgi:hypothetical protein